MINKIINGDALAVLKGMPPNIVDCCITSPPYYQQRYYGTDLQIWDNKTDCEHEWIYDKNKLSAFCKHCKAWKGELGLEPEPNLFIKHLTQIFAEVKRVLKDDGTIFVNMGDTARNKTMLLIPERFAMKMVDELKLKLRRTIIWQKPNVLPQSAKDNFTLDYEKIFFFVKQNKYYFSTQYEAANYDGRKDIYCKGSDKYEDAKIRIEGTNPMASRKHKRWQIIDGEKLRYMRSVWAIPNEPLTLNHFATFPQKLVKRLIEAGCKENGLVLDPFVGSGTTAIVAKKLNRNYIGIDLKSDIAEQRIIDEIGIGL